MKQLQENGQKNMLAEIWSYNNIQKVDYLKELLKGSVSNDDIDKRTLPIVRAGLH